MGGWETFGIQRSFDAIINPPELHPNANIGSGPAGIVDPDGTVTSVGFPQGVEEEPPSLGKCGKRRLAAMFMSSHIRMTTQTRWC